MKYLREICWLDSDKYMFNASFGDVAKNTRSFLMCYRHEWVKDKANMICSKVHARRSLHR